RAHVPLDVEIGRIVLRLFLAREPAQAVVLIGSRCEDGRYEAGASTRSADEPTFPIRSHFVENSSGSSIEIPTHGMLHIIRNGRLEYLEGIFVRIGCKRRRL